MVMFILHSDVSIDQSGFLTFLYGCKATNVRWKKWFDQHREDFKSVTFNWVGDLFEGHGKRGG